MRNRWMGYGQAKSSGRYLFQLIGFIVQVIPSLAQVSNEPSREEARFNRQCSALRELVYSAYQHQFKNIMQERLKGSQGYQVRGSWRFETVEYGSMLQWEGATRSFIDNSEETTDTSHSITRQFIAEFGRLPSESEAQRIFALLNRQVAACRLPLSDSLITIMTPLPAHQLPESLPYGVTDAKIYPVTITAGDAFHPAQEVLIMTAMERSGKRFVVYMIVEYTLSTRIATSSG